jgi:RNA polymerase sigma-70 factor (ECF subfamily)
MKDSVISMNQPPITRLMLKKDSNQVQLSDEDLVLRYKSTMDNYYVGVLFERYADVIYGISLKYLKNRHDAQDMMSVIFEKLVNVLRVKEVDRFRNWLFVLVRNQCLSKLRTWQTEQQRKQRYEDYVSQLKAPEDFFGSQVRNLRERESEEERMRAMLSSLPEKQRICIEYFYFEDRTYKEIATILDEQVGRIRSYIQNGRRNLKLKLTKGK